MTKLNIKVWIRQVLIMLICIAVAGWLRMGYRPVTHIYFLDLIGKPITKWLGAFVGMPLFEILYFIWGYFIAGTSYLLLANITFKNKNNLLFHLVLGTLHGTVGYLVIAAVMRELGEINEVIYLLLMYSTVGLVFGWLYYKLIIKESSHSIA